MQELEAFDYPFKEESIAQAPARPRESAKLLVYDRAKKKANWTTFANIARHLPPGAVLVLNETKVVPARLALAKPTGGRVRILYLGMEGGCVRALADRKLEPGMRLALTPKISFEVAGRAGKEYLLRTSFPPGRMGAVLERHGEAPIPPYIKRPPLSGERLRKEYQTVFARRKGSVAAPTASLHFTKKLLADIRRAGVEIRFVTLHVNLGTFAPLTEENLASGKLHEERFEIPAATAKALLRAKREGRKIIAVGTTVVRTLESAAGDDGNFRRLSGTTDLFIRPGYEFKLTDGIVTNFHVPKSSLLMLVAAFLPRTKLLPLYREAIQRRFRLFSFGDGMLIT